METSLPQSSSPSNNNNNNNNNTNKTDNSNRQPSKKQKRKRTSKNGCYHCGSTSHRARSCPSVICTLCKTEGHDAGSCPQREIRTNPPDYGSFHPDHTTTTTNSNSSNKEEEGELFTYVELFAGMGGFRLALDELNGRCVFSSEIDQFCRETYETNFGDLPAGDICQILRGDVDDGNTTTTTTTTTTSSSSNYNIPEHDLLVGGFPCQPFSSSAGSQRLGINDPSGRGRLFQQIVRILTPSRGRKRPKGFLLENVRGLSLHDDGRTLNHIVGQLEGCGYRVKYELVDAVKLVPQERIRLFIVGIRNDLYEKNGGNGGEFVFPEMVDLKRCVGDILQTTEQLSTIDIDIDTGDAKNKHKNKMKSSDEPKTELEQLTLSEAQFQKVWKQSYTKQHPEGRFLLKVGEKPAKTIQSSYMKYMVGSQFVPVMKDKKTDATKINDDRNVDVDIDVDVDVDIDENDAVDTKTPPIPQSTPSPPPPPSSKTPNLLQQIPLMKWRRFSKREVARLQGMPESFVLHPKRAHHMVGNAVAPPVISMIGACLLCKIGIGPPGGSDGGNDGDGWEWGWSVTKGLLLDASPVDGGRRDRLERLLVDAERRRILEKNGKKEKR